MKMKRLVAWATMIAALSSPLTAETTQTAPKALDDIPGLVEVEPIGGMRAFLVPGATTVWMYDEDRDLIVNGTPFSIEGATLHPDIPEEFAPQADLAHYLDAVYGPFLGMEEEAFTEARDMFDQLKGEDRDLMLTELRKRVVELGENPDEAAFRQLSEGWIADAKELLAQRQLAAANMVAQIASSAAHFDMLDADEEAENRPTVFAFLDVASPDALSAVSHFQSKINAGGDYVLRVIPLATDDKESLAALQRFMANGHAAQTFKDMMTGKTSIDDLPAANEKQIAAMTPVIANNDAVRMQLSITRVPTFLLHKDGENVMFSNVPSKEQVTDFFAS